jgi:uncharacterized protein
MADVRIGAKTPEEIAEPTTILRGLVGSTIHGLGVNDGVDDRDEMGVCVEDIEYALGVTHDFEQWVYRTQPQGVRSGPGDLDLTVYSLRKYCRLALQGNPTILLLLFVPTSECVVRDARGAQLQELAPAFASREAGKRFLGYMEAQRQRLTGERGQKNVNRPELVERYGFDTKFAMHMLRLGLQGIEYMRTGRLALPMAEPERSYLRGVRTGAETLQAVLTRAGELEREMKDLLTTSPLPERPDSAAVERYVSRTYLEAWKARRYLDDSRGQPDGSGAR